MEERELVQRILQGDEKAKTEFFVTYRERLYRNCVYLLGYQDPEAEDVVQDVFITAFEKLPEFEFRSSLSTWLTQICIYKCHNRFRQRAKLVNQEEAQLDVLLQTTAVDRQDEKDRQKEKRRLIEQGLEKIGKECRQIIEFREFQEKSYIEIGKAMKVPLGTVMSRLSRCKRALKILIESLLKEG